MNEEELKELLEALSRLERDGLIEHVTDASGECLWRLPSETAAETE